VALLPAVLLVLRLQRGVLLLLLLLQALGALPLCTMKQWQLQLTVAASIWPCQ
jgi:hypothetical protein